jgi:hypothetical protein
MYLLGIVRAVRYPTATAPGLFYINTPVPMSTLSSVNVLVRASPSLSLPATFHLSNTRTAGGGGGAKPYLAPASSFAKAVRPFLTFTNPSRLAAPAILIMSTIQPQFANDRYSTSLTVQYLL